MQPREDFLLKAYELGIIKFGNFTLKSGIENMLKEMLNDKEIVVEAV